MVAGNDDFCSLQSQVSCCVPEGTYYIVVDGYSSANGTYALNVTFAVNPCEAYTANLQSLTAPGTVTGSTVGDPNVYGGAAGDQGITLTIPYTSVWNIDACKPGTDFAADLYLFTASPCAGGTLITSNTSGTCGYVATTARILAYQLAAGTYHLMVGHTAAVEGAFEVAVEDACGTYNSNTVALNAPGTVTGSTVGAPHIYAGVSGDQGIDISIPYAGEWNFDTCITGTSYAADVYLFTASPCDGGTLIASNTTATCAVFSTAARLLNIGLQAGTYHLLVGNTGTTEGAFALSVFANATPRPTFGGPDTFGYMWRNSLDAEGPAFDWVDITGVGTLITLSGGDGYSGAIPMGLDFPFYGTSYNTCYVGTDGYLSFNAIAGSYYNNQTIPATALPNNIIALFWDDLFNAAGSTCHYYQDLANGRFIVQYTNFTKTSVPLTFQALLYENGEVVVQYLNTPEIYLNSATLGMENATGTVGILANFNNTGGALWDGIATKFFVPEVDDFPPAIAHTPLPSTEAAGPWTVSANITDAQSGVISADLHYQVNGGGITSVSMTEGTPPAWTADIPDQTLGSTISYFITAVDGANPANQATSPTWSFVKQDWTAPPQNVAASDDQIERVVVSWEAPDWASPAMMARPGDEPRFEDFLNLGVAKETAWQQYQTALATWQASLQDAGRAFITYNVYRENMLLGSTTNLSYTHISFDVGVAYTYSVRALFDAGESVAGSDSGMAAPRPTSGGPDAQGYTWVNSLDANGPEYSWVDISATGTQIASPSDDGYTGPYNLGFTFPFYENQYTNVYVASNGFLTFGTGNGSLTNQNLPNTTTPNNLVAVFWDDMAPHYVGSTIHYLADAENNRFIVQYHVPHYASVSPYTFLDFQAILTPDGNILIQYLNMVEEDVSQATLGIENSTGTVGLTANFDGAGTRLADEMAYLFAYPEGDWFGPVIVHTPLPNTELDGPYTVTATITDEDSNVAGATLYYQINGGGYVSVAMTDNAPTFTAAIPDQTPPATVQYYIVAVDDSPQANQTTSPTWTFNVVDWTWPPQNFTASDGLLGEVQLSWSSPSPAAPELATAPQLPSLEELMATGLSKDAAYTWLVEHTPVDDAGRAFQTYRVYRNGNLVGTTQTTSYVDVPPTTNVYTYHVTALFDAGESNPSNSDTGYMTARPTSGGPDAFGYLWMNSDDPSGDVVYNWIEAGEGIGTEITALTNQDDAYTTITLPRPLSLYSTTYTDLVVSTNGWLSFITQTSSYLTNGTIPNAAAPNGIIAPFWDDLDLSGTEGTLGHIYSYDDAANNRFIVQWDEVPHYSGTPASPRYTFQAVLNDDGSVVFQYETMDGVRNSATVGVENTTGTDGLQVNYNDAGGRIGNALAVRIGLPVVPECGAPDNVQVTMAGGNATISWDAVDGALSYKVYAAGDGYGVFTLLATTAGTSHLDLNAQAAGRKFYQIVAVCE
jgi:hypothetical protein